MPDQERPATEGWSRHQLLHHYMDTLELTEFDRLTKCGYVSFVSVVPPQQRADDIILFYGLLVRRRVAYELCIHLADTKSVEIVLDRDHVYCLETDPDLAEAWLVEEVADALSDLRRNLPDECWPPEPGVPDRTFTPAQAEEILERPYQDD